MTKHAAGASDGDTSSGPPVGPIADAATQKLAQNRMHPEPIGLLQTSVLSGFATLVRVGTGMAISKVVALWVGPTGLAMVGQFGSFVATAGAFAGGGINLGITKYMAEYSTSAGRRTRLLSTALRITLASAIVLAAVVVLLRRQFATWLLGDAEYSSVFAVFGASVLLLAVNSLLLAVMNGAREIRKLVALNVISSLSVLGLSIALIGSLNLYGALLAIALSQSATLIFSLMVARRSEWFRPRYFAGRYDRATAQRLGKYALMALATAVTLPLSHILVRNHLAATFSWEAAGYWQGLWQISEGYLLVVTTSLSMYYLPRLSELKDASEIRREVLSAYRTLMPVAVVAAILIYLLRDIIIVVLYSGSFAPMRDLFAAQLVGDVLKVASWMLSYLMVAKAMTGLFVLTEVVFAGTFLALTILLTSMYGLVGVSYAFGANYALYFLTMIALFGRRLGVAS